MVAIASAMGVMTDGGTTIVAITQAASVAVNKENVRLTTEQRPVTTSH